MVFDDVVAQHRLATELFGLRTIALVVGWSMGAQQTYQWAVSHPEMVERIAPFCGTAKTTPHNAVFLEGVRAALTTDCAPGYSPGKLGRMAVTAGPHIHTNVEFDRVSFANFEARPSRFRKAATVSGIAKAPASIP